MSIDVLKVMDKMADIASREDRHLVGRHYATEWGGSPWPRRPAGTFAVMRNESKQNAVCVSSFPSRDEAVAEANRLNGGGDISEARAAVAELIGAARETEAALLDFGLVDRLTYRLSAALARIGGST